MTIAKNLRTDRLPAVSFATIAHDPPRRITFDLLDPPARVLEEAGATARNVRSWGAEIEGEPHLYLILASDVPGENGEEPERVVTIGILPYGEPNPTTMLLDEDRVAALASPFYAEGEEITVRTVPGRVIAVGPASDLPAPTAVAGIDQRPGGMHA